MSQLQCQYSSITIAFLFLIFISSNSLPWNGLSGNKLRRIFRHRRQHQRRTINIRSSSEERSWDERKGLALEEYISRIMKENYNPHSSLSEVLSSVGEIAAIIYNFIIYFFAMWAPNNSLSVTTTSAGSYRTYRGGGESGEDINLYRGSIQSFGDPSVSNDRVNRNVVLSAVWIATVQALGSIVTHDRFFDEVRLRQMLRYLYSKDAEFAISCIILLILSFFRDSGCVKIYYQGDSPGDKEHTRNYT